MIAWHYTTGLHLPLIEASDLIKPGTTLVPKGERPIAWFSINQEYELTAAKCWVNRRPSVYSAGGLLVAEKTQLLPMKLEEMDTAAKGVFRIGVTDSEPLLQPFERICRIAHMDPRMMDSLASTGRQRGANPDDWRGTIFPVVRSRWLVIEQWLTDGSWKTVRTLR